MLLAALALAAAWAAKPALPTVALPAWSSLSTAPAFQPASREVNVWRREAALALDLSPQLTFSLLRGEDLRGSPPRCIKLNNYWCIKRAGWIGEIAADGEGHVAFASAREGAAVAALLLRRYYVNFGLKTAQAITARWAPAQCGGGYAGGGSAGGGRRTVVGGGIPLGGLTRNGLGSTVRAKWLATHTVGGQLKGVAAAAKPRKPVGMASATLNDAGATAAPKPKGTVAAAEPSRGKATPLRRTMSVERGVDSSLVIMAGAGAPATERFGLLPFAGIPMGPTPGGKIGSLPPLSTCAGESARVATYAVKASQGVAAPDADLQLFDAAGKPTDNLAKVMANMAAVEIGPYRASNAVIAAGVADLAARLR